MSKSPHQLTLSLHIQHPPFILILDSFTSDFSLFSQPADDAEASYLL